MTNDDIESKEHSDMMAALRAQYQRRRAQEGGGALFKLGALFMYVLSFAFLFFLFVLFCRFFLFLLHC